VTKEDTGLGAAARLLKRHGFEPAPAADPGGTVLLRNCPFRDVAQEAPALVCEMNLAFIRGVLEGLDVRGAEAKLDPSPQRCCVTLQGGQA
jgi:predicted ArsR family transcriptional regulator